MGTKKTLAALFCASTLISSAFAAQTVAKHYDFSVITDATAATTAGLTQVDTVAYSNDQLDLTRAGYLHGDSGLTQNDNFILEIVLNIDAQDVYDFPVALTDPNPSNNGYGVLVENNNWIGFRMGKGSIAQTPFTVDQEVHLAVVRDGGVERFFVDGVELANPTNRDYGGSVARINIGSNPHDGAAGYFDGQINEVRTSTFGAGTFSLTYFLNYDPTPVNVAGDGTGVMGLIDPAADLSAAGTEFIQSGSPAQTYLVDGNAADDNGIVRNWNGQAGNPFRNNADVYSYVGVTWSATRSDTVSSIQLVMNDFGDGGWFGTNSDTVTPVEPTVQITTDGGTTWINVAHTSDYLTQVTEANATGGAFPTATFTLTTPVTGIDGIRLIGEEGGTASGGFIGVREIEVYAAELNNEVELSVSNASSTAFDLTWDEIAGATDYRLTIATDANLTTPVTGYDNKSITPGAGATITENVTSLTPSTTYYYSVGVDTGSGIINESYGLITLFYADHLSYDFEGGDAQNWYFAANTGADTDPTVTPWSGYTFYNNSGYALSTTDGTGDGSTAIIESPVITLSNDVSYDGIVEYWQGGGNHLSEVYFAAYLASDNSVIGGPTTGQSQVSVTQKSFDLSAYKGQNVYFRLVDNRTGSWGHALVDHVALRGAVDTAATDARRAGDVEIEGYDVISDVDAGPANSPTYANAAAVITYLDANVTSATITDSSPAATTPITGWTETGSYDASTPGSYTFTGTLGTVPNGYVDAVDTITTVTVEVVVGAPVVALTVGDVIAIDLGTGANDAANFNIMDSGDGSIAAGNVVKYADGTTIASGVSVTLTGTYDAGGAGNPGQSDDWVGIAADPYYVAEATDLVYRNPTAPISVTFSGLDKSLKYNVRIYAIYDDGNGATDTYTVTCGTVTEPSVVARATRKSKATLEEAGGVFNFLEADESGNITTNVQVTAGTGWNAYNAVVLEVVDPVTPAIGLELSQTGNELTWTVEDEVSVREYQVTYTLNGETKTQVVTAKGADFYTIDLPEGATDVELVVVDESGYRQTYLPEAGDVSIEVYDLEEGWNLIAVTSDDADLETLKDETVGVLWGWNGTGYEIVETASATDAVWVYTPVAKQVYVSGTKSTAKINLNLGWNMVGPVENDYIPAEADTVYSWSKVYDIIAGEDKVLIGGKGYWIFSL